MLTRGLFPKVTSSWSAVKGQMGGVALLIRVSSTGALVHSRSVRVAAVVMADYGGADVAQMRKPYYTLPEAFTEKSLVSRNPIKQFHAWFKYASAQEDIPEPNAMTICTVDKAGRPSARMVLLKGYSDEGFKFFTNYNSRKCAEIAGNPNVALCFYWGSLNRSVRVEGVAEKMSRPDSEKYFVTRPRRSQIAAHVSTPQSGPVRSREALEQKESVIEEKYKDSAVPMPEFWGGFLVRPQTIEFWQGQSNRMHDRLRFRKRQPDDDTASSETLREGEDGWVYERLFP